MNDGSTLEALSSIISGFGAIVTAVTALVAIQTYRMSAGEARRAQDAKRREEAYYQMSRLFDSPGSRNAAGLLAFPDWEIPLPTADSPRRWSRISQDEAAAALLPKSIVPPTRDEVKTAIQDCFHDFMQRFYILEELITKDMIDQKDCADLIYRWSGTLAADAHDATYSTSAQRLARNFRIYAFENSYDLMLKLFERYGKSVRPTADDWESLRRETEAEGSAVRVDWVEADGRRRKQRPAEPPRVTGYVFRAG